MISALIIGMGRFGRYLSLRLSELGNEVMAVDTQEAALQPLLPYVTRAQICDCTEEDALRSLGVNNFDICVVCIGSDFQNSLEITALLKELGARYVISKASEERHAKFLLRNGADEVVYPEQDIAERLAVRYSVNNVFDLIPIGADVAIYEIPILPEWAGKTVGELQIRNQYALNVLAIKHGELVDAIVTRDDRFEPNDHIMVMGLKKDVQRLLQKLPRKDRGF